MSAVLTAPAPSRPVAGSLMERAHPLAKLAALLPVSAVLVATVWVALIHFVPQLAVLLLAVTATVIGAYARSSRIAPGFDPGGVLAAQVRLPAVGMGPGATGPASWWHQPHPAHHASQGNELLGRALVERAMADGADVGGDQAHPRLLLVVPGAVRRGLGVGELERGADLGALLDGVRRRVRLVAFVVEEVSSEDAVVGRQLLDAGDQGGASGPVHVDEIGGIE